MVGQTISHYRIVEKLGEGGMGVVYKATDIRLNRPVALKFLSAQLTKDPEANQRFVQEAQAASALDHPNICTIHEIDETPNRELFLTMAYYDGETLKQRIARGPISIEDALSIAVQISQALGRAHQSGIVHRDVKPANVMIGNDGLVKILDFGLAKLAGHSDLTRTGTTVGTVAYMSPEQIRGGEVDAPTDVWAIGAVLYEMLAGRKPFDGKDELAIISSILEDSPPPIGRHRDGLPRGLERIVSRALEKMPGARYASASELLADLANCRDAMTAARQPPPPVLHVLRRPLVAASVALVLIAAGIPALIAYRRASLARWTQNEAIPQIMQLISKDDYAGAFALAKEAEHYAPTNSVLAGLWPQFSFPVSITTIPDGADVSVQPYAASDDHWASLGRTPINGLRLARGVFRFKVEKAGYQSRLLASNNPGPLLLKDSRGTARIAITLVPVGESTETIPVSGGAFPVGLNGFNSDVSVNLAPFEIDRHEVTNKEYKRFVERGGYTKPEPWRALAIDSASFVDATGRPGPAVWELGDYPAAQGEYPVTGVNWYEAVAYCRAMGKELPTVYHWARAGLSPVEIGAPLAPAVIPLSNFGGKGLAAVGAYRGVGPYGTDDMAGNAREWVWNEAAGGRRWILGGAWNDPDYMFTTPNSLPPLDRSAANGFRCARYAPGAPVPASLLAPVQTYSRDHRAARAVSDEVFDVFKRQYAYVKSPLNDRVESKDTSSPDWVREKITLDAGYETGRVAAYLFLPTHAAPPYQLVVFFPGVAPFVGRTPSDSLQPGAADFVVKAGRALVHPVYKGSFERWDPFVTLQGDEYLRTFRTRMGQWRQDLGRVIDTLAKRPDIDTNRIAYYGASFGASTAFPLIALEPRIKVSVLGPAGFTYRELPPEADAINYVAHVTMPVLMMGGSHDYIFPLESAQKPMFERLGSPADQKRQVTFDSGHTNFPRSEMIREVLAWLDRYLGPVKSSMP
jgi:serine/threonine protein kinase/dienelactone hydrolase